MTTADRSFEQLSDCDLLAELKRLAQAERAATAALIAALAEVDARRLYLGARYSSLFMYCTQALHFSEHAAYLRIEAARVARRFPIVVDSLADGSVHLTGISLLAPHLTVENHREILADARHKSKRDIEHLVARLRPKPDVSPSVRKLPATAPRAPSMPTSSVVAAVPSERIPVEPIRPAIVAPLAPQRYKIQFTVSKDTHDKLRRAQDMTRHMVPNGDLAVIFDRALTLLVEDLERQKIAAAKRPRACAAAASPSRHIPAAVRRAVWARDAGRCAFTGSDGRCTETGLLEFHHVVPYAAGGQTSVDNLELRCRAHNQYEADRFFGPLFVREERTEWSELGPDLARSGGNFCAR